MDLKLDGVMVNFVGQCDRAMRYQVKDFFVCVLVGLFLDEISI